MPGLMVKVSFILNGNQSAGLSFRKLSLILEVKASPISGKILSKNKLIASLKSFELLKNLLFLTCSFITFQRRSIGFKFGL